jgi:hypothetical protein
MLNIQPDARVCRYLFTAKSLDRFRVSQHPSSGVLKTVTAASGTGHDTGTATSLQRGPIQQYADIYLLQSHSTCFGCHSTHHQEY